MYRAPLLLLIGALVGYPEVQSISFLRSFGTPEVDLTRAVAAGAEAIYVAGHTEGTFPRQTRAGEGRQTDAFLRKFDTSGEELWTRQFGTPAPDYAEAVAVDASGIYIVGTTFGAFPGQSKTGSQDVFLRKYDASGNELWTRQFGAKDHCCGAAQTVVYAVAANQTGVYIVGWTNGAFPNPSNSGIAFLQKYDARGNEHWTRVVDAEGYTTVYGVAVHGTSVYIVGDRYWSIREPSNGFIRKYDSNGTEFWTRAYEVKIWSILNGVTADATGIYVAGEIWQDLLLRKYDVNGVELWSRQFRFPGWEYFRKAWSVTSDGTSVYVAATAQPPPTDEQIRQRDVCVGRFDAMGTELWLAQFPAPAESDIRVGIAANAAGIFVAGALASPNAGNASAKYDAFLARIERRTGTPVVTMLSSNAALTNPSAITSDGETLFVVNRSTPADEILSMPVGGGNVTRLFRGVPPTPRAITSINQRLFWISPHSGPLADTQIFSAPKDGTAPFRAIYTAATAGQPILHGSGITSDGSDVFTVDQFQGRVHRLRPDGSGITQLGTRWQGGAEAERLQTIQEGSGMLYIVDAGKSGVAQPGVFALPASGGTFTTLHKGYPLVCPSAVTVRKPDQIFVADPCARTLWKMPASGGVPQELLSGTAFGGISGITFQDEVLYATTPGKVFQIIPRLCDQDWNAAVDNRDIAQIFAARGQASSGPNDPRDVNGDGFITLDDARKCALFCTHTNCAP